MSTYTLSAAAIERAIHAGNLSPAARDMRPADVLAQYAEANGISRAEALRELDPRPYRITSHGRTYRFATADEAIAAADDYYARTGFLVGVERDAE